MRKERDKIGEMFLENDVLYGIHTERARINFNISEKKVNLQLIYAAATVKKACAMAHKELNMLDTEKADAVINACNTILAGRTDSSFITNALQGGAGTSTNMNVNEVIANLALESIGRQYGEYEYINPLDDVNKGQSTNDVYPTALRIACVQAVRKLSGECARLQEALQKKENDFSNILKLGRTQLMDALPITLGQEFGAFAQAIARDRWRIYKVEERLRSINLGGTAVGTGSNTNRKFMYKVTDILRDLTGIGLARAEYPMDLTQNNDVFVEVSGLLKALAVNLMKISTDLRLMNSGPYGGLGEISLEELQAGSSIMPGKVNPVIPEMITQTAIKVMANDTAITMCAANGNFELNAFMPLIADSLLESLDLLINALPIFRTKCIDTLKADAENCRKHLNNSMVLITALSPVIGYDEAAQISKQCGGDPGKIKELVLAKGILSAQELDNILNFRSEMTYLK